MTREIVTCQTCGQAFTQKQSKGHANAWGHYKFTTTAGTTINHSRYAS